MELQLQHPGKVIISGYENDLYNTTLKGWHKEINNGYAEYYGGRERTEVIWMNFEPQQRQLGLFE